MAGGLEGDCFIGPKAEVSSQSVSVVADGLYAHYIGTQRATEHSISNRGLLLVVMIAFTLSLFFYSMA